MTVAALKNKLKKRIKSHISLVKSPFKSTFQKSVRKCQVDIDIETCLTDTYCRMCKEKRMILSDNTLSNDCCVDHYHADDNDKGPIRGLLCSSCNTIEGKVRQKVEKCAFSYVDIVKKFGIFMVSQIEKLYKGTGGVFPMQIDNKNVKK
jgi:hypothetical protein